MSTTIGLDVGGTKIAGGVVDEHGRILVHERRETPAQDPDGIAQACADLVAVLRRDHDVSAVGVAAAGLVDAEGSTVLFAPNLAWRAEPMRERLSGRVGLPVDVENDANCAAWGEFRFGAAADSDDMLLVTVGTGIGGGIVVDGELLRGSHGVAAEIGHVRVVPEGLRCGCGRKGCLEMYTSGSALLRDARELVRGGKAAALALSERCAGNPEALEGRHVTELAQQGDPASLDLVTDVGVALGEGIASICAVIDPGCVVIGGGVSAAGDLLLTPVRDTLLRNLVGRGYRPEPTVRLASLGNDAGLVGAADLARRMVQGAAG